MKKRIIFKLQKRGLYFTGPRRVFEQIEVFYQLYTQSSPTRCSSSCQLSGVQHGGQWQGCQHHRLCPRSRLSLRRPAPGGRRQGLHLRCQQDQGEATLAQLRKRFGKKKVTKEDEFVNLFDKAEQFFKVTAGVNLNFSFSSGFSS